MNDQEYIQLNKASWNQRVKPHIESDFYKNDQFMEGMNSLNQIELDLLGDLSGKKVAHLQCHFGQDTISLSRLGAEAWGLDLSDEAVSEAQKLADACKSNAQFVCGDVYKSSELLPNDFDMVFSSYGTIGWLPELDSWAKAIHDILKPGGEFVFAEFHPVIWMMDDPVDTIEYNYFNDGPIRETQEGTYADREADIKLEYITWNHSLSEVFEALFKQGFTINAFHEFDYSPYACFQGVEEFEPGKFRIKKHENRLPLVYSLKATKPH